MPFEFFGNLTKTFRRHLSLKRVLGADEKFVFKHKR